MEAETKDTLIVGALILSFFVMSFMAINEVGNRIDDNGGLGKSIGRFINNVKSEIE